MSLPDAAGEPTAIVDYVAGTLELVDEVIAALDVARGELRSRLYALRMAEDPDVAERIAEVHVRTTAGEAVGRPVSEFIEKVRASSGR